MKTNRAKKSMYNAITMIISTGILSLLSLVTTSLILKNYGSDFNGVVATASQLINLLLIVEGGFSLAINVALFKPLVENDVKKMSSIMVAAKKTFLEIGLIFLSLGFVVAMGYSFLIKSNLDYLTVFLIFMMVIITTSYQLLFVIKCQIMFQANQKEYIYMISSIVVNVLSSVTTIALILLKTDMLLIRFVIMLFALLNGFITYLLYKRYFSFIDMHAKPNYAEIKGTNDIMVQKIMSIIYVAAPLLFISTFISTKMASVYAVYYSIYNIIKMFLSSLVAAPVNGFGQLLSESRDVNVYKKFKLYEFTIIIASTILLSSVLAVIIPFISLYTKNVTDINYVNFYFALMMGIIIFLEIIHIPSGHIINVTGNFKDSKKIQTISCITLVLLLIIGGVYFGIYGILFGTIITNILLASLETSYVHKKIFNSSIWSFLKPVGINVVAIFICYILDKLIIFNITNYLHFFANGILILIFNTLIIGFINYIFLKSDLLLLKDLTFKTLFSKNK